MRHSRAEKAATHQRIVQIAARRFRERGFDGIGVAEIMQEAGLTVGGFYKHFDSRDALVCEALAATFATTANWSEQARGSLRSAISTYLAPLHRDNLGESCVLATLLNDMPRSTPDTVDTYTARLRGMFAFFEQLLPAASQAQRRIQARTIFSACVGALTLSRAVDDPALARDILDTVTDQLVDAFTEATPATA